MEQELLRFTTAGSVDDGKSTLIGRLLYDSKNIFQDQFEQLESTSKLRGEEGVNLALLTDGLRAEREQGITIDVAYRYFATPKRKFIIAETAGHEQYTRNMVTGASTADLAIVLIDARNGITTQSKRHGFIASLLGIKHVLIAINKMDLVDYSQEVFDRIKAEYESFAEKLSVHDLIFVPVSALMGDNVVEPSARMGWYSGGTIMNHLETVTLAANRNLVDFRFPVQIVARPHQDFRGYAGRIASGTIQPGEPVVVLPSGRRSKVKEVWRYDEKVDEAFEGESTILTLEDEIDISRGDMIVRENNVPRVAEEFDGIITWMDSSISLDKSTRYILHMNTQEVQAEIERLYYQIDVNTLHRSEADTLHLNEIGRVRVRTGKSVFFDTYDSNRNTGSFILVDPHSNLTVAAGMITRESTKIEDQDADTDAPKSTNIEWDRSSVGLEERIARNGHRPKVLWFTGLSGSGKSTIARAVERALFKAGKQVARLDGDNVRHGLSADLGFDPEDRKKNIRRIGHAARLFYDHGMITICTFVSPYHEDRDYVRSLMPDGDFLEIYVHASLNTLRDRDPKGLYAKAERGEIQNLTGVQAPYEVPVQPNITVNTEELSVDEAVNAVLSLLA